MLDRHVAATINATTVWHGRSRVCLSWRSRTGLTGSESFAIMAAVIGIKPGISIHQPNAVEKRADVHEYFSSVFRLAPARRATLISSEQHGE